jgi:hypothetical protein
MAIAPAIDAAADRTTAQRRQHSSHGNSFGESASLYCVTCARWTGIFATTAAALFAACPLVLVAYKDGPAPAMTGGFGEMTCQKCHFDAAINARGGAVRVEGVPAAYVPGREYPLTVIVRRAGIMRAGFEMSARFAPGTPGLAGRQAGAFTAPTPRMQIVFEPGKTIQYIQHTKAGSQTPAPGEGRWTFTWTAPVAPAGAVQFNIAANASNDDASPLGDFIYTATATSRGKPVR